MTPEEELLAEAREKYPIGTVFKSAQSGSTFTVDADSYFVQGSDIRCYVNKRKWEPFLRFNGDWSKIISSPVPQVINNYPIF